MSEFITLPVSTPAALAGWNLSSTIEALDRCGRALAGGALKGGGLLNDLNNPRVIIKPLLAPLGAATVPPSLPANAGSVYP
ncbi:MAG: hypothetical protein V7739_15175 [Motiliproteus sp.]